jgi:hypothetical protein
VNPQNDRYFAQLPSFESEILDYFFVPVLLVDTKNKSSFLVSADLSNPYKKNSIFVPVD